LFLVLFRWLTVRPVRWRDSLPGAVISAVSLQLLQLAASAFISHKLQGASKTYGKDVAGVIVLLSWFFLQAQVVLIAAEVNVVRQYKLWPRGLTDPPATEADFRTFEAYAERERYRPEEDVDTSFDGQDNPIDRPTDPDSVRDAHQQTPLEERRQQQSRGTAEPSEASSRRSAAPRRGRDDEAEPQEPAYAVKTITTVDPYPFEAAAPEPQPAGLIGRLRGALRR
jgi:hypothetical protein